MDAFGFAGRWALVPPTAAEPIGMTRAEMRDAAGGADVLLNVAGMLADPDVLEAVPVRAYLDLDPAFTQLWNAVEGVDMRFDAHTHFVTPGRPRSASPSSPIPDGGREWIPTLPPVVLDEWPPAERLERRALTTVGHWRSYGSIHHDGVHYGQKAHSLRPLIDLPAVIGRRSSSRSRIHPDEARRPGGAARERLDACSTPARSRRRPTPTGASSRARGPSSGSPSPATSSRTPAGSAIAAPATWRAAGP